MASKIKGNMLSVNEIIALRTAAVKGDAEAFKTLYAENARLAKRANSRMSALEKAGMAYYAYERAAGFLASEHDATRFTTSKKILTDAYELAQNILEERTFLRAKTSTISGQKELKARRAESLKKLGVELPKGKEDDFLRFLGSDTIQNALIIVGRKSAVSAELVDALSGMFDKQSGKTGVLRYVNNLLNKFNSGQVAYDEVTEYLERKS